MPLRDNADIQYTSMWGAAIPLPQHEKADGTFVVTGENNPMPIMALGQVPVQEQSRLTPQEKFASAVSVSAGGTQIVAYVPMTGYTDFGIGIIATVSHTWGVNVLPSADGTQTNMTYAADLTISTGASITKGGKGQSTLEYIAIQIVNNDTVARTYDIWVRKVNR